MRFSSHIQSFTAHNHDIFLEISTAHFVLFTTHFVLQNTYFRQCCGQQTMK